MRQRQRRVLAAGDHQVQPRRQMVEQEDDRGVHGGAADDVVAVQDEDAGGGQRDQVVDEFAEPRPRPGGGWASSQADAFRPQAGANVRQAATRQR